MNEIVKRLLSGVTLGEPSAMGPLSVVPVFSTLATGPAYVTLAEAFRHGWMRITEVDETGSVGEVVAVNEGDVGVVALDGEELRGAKQNRALNTPVYLPPRVSVRLPVSCVEAGRWELTSPVFADSGYMVSSRVRYAVADSASASVWLGLGPTSDQRRVWHTIDSTAVRRGVNSPTKAMRDVFEHRSAEFGRLAADVGREERQCGAITVRDGHVIGLDLFSRPEAYAGIHGRLMLSYCCDVASPRLCAASPNVDDLAAAKRFLVSLVDTEATPAPGPGSGVCHWFRGPDVVGRVLTYRGALLFIGFHSVPCCCERTNRDIQVTSRGV